MLNRRKMIQSLAVLAAPGTALGTVGKSAEKPLPELGGVLQVPGLTLLDGRPWMPFSGQAKVLVVYWWASWCPFCALQSPHIEALWRAQRARGLEVLALSMDSRPEAAVAYIKARGYRFPAAMYTPQIAEVLPKPRGLPVVVVLQADGRGGKVVFAEAGEMFPEDVEGLKKFL